MKTNKTSTAIYTIVGAVCSGLRDAEEGGCCIDRFGSNLGSNRGSYFGMPAILIAAAAAAATDVVCGVEIGVEMGGDKRDEGEEEKTGAGRNGGRPETENGSGDDRRGETRKKWN